MKKLIVQHRRGTKEALEQQKILPYEGEVVVEPSAANLKIGDGLTEYAKLPYITDNLDKKTAELEIVTTETRQTVEELTTKVTSLDETVTTTTGRVDALVAGTDDPAEGSWEKELRDIRVNSAGTTFSTAGNAVRAVEDKVETLRDELEQFIGAEAVDGLSYEDSMLQLTAAGKPVGEAVKIVAGTGGGGGGGGSFTVRLQNKTELGNNFSVTTADQVVLSFIFTSTEDGEPTGDYSAVVEVDGVKRKTMSLAQGIVQSVDVTGWLKADDNTVKITCTDMYDNYRTLVYKINVIELTLASSFNANMVYREAEWPGGVDVRYKPTGLIDKTVYFNLDGSIVAKVPLKASTSGKEQSQVFPIETLTHGAHTLKIYAEAEQDGTTIHSNTLIYDVLVHRTNETAPMIGSTIDFDTVTAGDLVSIPYVVYDPTAATCEVTLCIDNDIEYTSRVTVDQTLQTWSTRKYPTGDDITFTITYQSPYMETPIVKTHHIKIEEASFTVEPEAGAKLELTSQGRSNNEQNPAVWTSNGYTTTFKNFNWKSNGWVADSNGDTCLRLSGGAQATINFAPLSSTFFNIQNNGITIEIEFAVRDVNNRDTTIISCLGYNAAGQETKGFKFTADKAYLKSAANQVACNYKDEEKIKVAFTIDKTGNQADGKTPSNEFLCVYLNGVLSSIVKYTSTDFNHDNYITLGDTGATLDIYSIRAYNKVLTARELTNNFIADILEHERKVDIYEDNNIYTSAGLLSYAAVKEKIPTVTFIGTMPTYKGDKKIVQMDYVNPYDHSKDFANVYGGPIYVLIDVQGTSSQWYVRKNWKVKLKDKKLNGYSPIATQPFQHMDNELPAWTFCFKVDYAEGTGTHNTQNANFVETLYSELIPAQDVAKYPDTADSRVRTTVTGFPVVIYEQPDADSDPVFSSKGNFNFDKSAEDAFGFNSNWDVESWEFRNNTSAPCLFSSEFDPTQDYMNDFEPRYLTNDTYTIDDLEAAEDLYDESLDVVDDEGNVTTPGRVLSEEEKQLITDTRKSCIANFKALHDWVVSTNQTNATGNTLETPYVVGTTQYTSDTAQYRLAKFKNEFEDHFDLHYTLIYYIYTSIALMVDQRAKNMFFTRWKNPTTGKSKWYPYFYDNDTSWGINNEGYLVFDYYHEDIDIVENAKVYNGQDSAFWVNFSSAFQSDIKTLYATLRSEKKLTYDNIINQFVTEGSQQWSESVYNEDAEYKYVSMARWENTTGSSVVTTGNLYQVRGTGEEHLRYFVNNRIKYFDSKWYAGDYPDDTITLRVNTPADTSNLKVAPDPKITVTPYSNMYCGVRYKANGTLEQKRATKNTPVTFGSDIVIGDDASEKFSDTETGIYGASELSSIGNLSPLYLSIIQAEKAERLTELQIGTRFVEGYDNPTLRQVQVGANRLLQTIDLTGCSGLGTAGETKQTALDLSGCENIENVYVRGTSLQSVKLPSAGYIKVLQLPKTLTELQVTNHPNLTDENLTIGDGLEVENISILNISNCAGIDTTALLDTILENAPHIERVRLTDINWTDKTVEDLKKLYTSKADGGYGLKGIDDNGAMTDTIYLSGTCVLNENIDGATMAELSANLPRIKFTMGKGYKLTSVVRFYADDAKTLLWTETLEKEVTTDITCDDPVEANHISTPTKIATAQYNFEWNGWSRNSDAASRIGDKAYQEDALKNVLGDRNLYPTFSPKLRSYTATFKTGNKVLYSVVKDYGTTVTFDSSKVTDATQIDDAEHPRNTESSSPDSYEFTGWFPTLDTIIVGDTTFTSQFKLYDDKYYVPELSDFTYTTSDDKLTIQKYNNTQNYIVAIPDTFTGDKTYTTTAITGFGSVNGQGEQTLKLEVVRIPDSVETIGTAAFYKMTSLNTLTLGKGIKTLNGRAFSNSSALKTIYFNCVNAKCGSDIFTYSDGRPFDCIHSAQGADVYIGSEVTALNTNVFAQASERGTAARAINTLDMSNALALTSIESEAFTACNPKEIKWGPAIKTIGSSAFANNSYIETLELPSSLTNIRVSAFSYWNALKKIKLPKSVELDPGAFRYIPELVEFECESGSKYKFTNGCLLNGTTLVCGTYKATIPENVTAFSSYAFAGCTKLTSIDIPASITSIATETFGSCKGLTNVTLHSGLQLIDQMAFYECNALTDIEIPETVTDIRSLVFASSGLKSLVIPKSVSKLGAGVLMNCTNLEEVWILNPDGVSGFVNTDALGVTTYDLFSMCTKLKRINVGWSKGVVPGADYMYGDKLNPWGCPNPDVEINYNVTEVTK